MMGTVRDEMDAAAGGPPSWNGRLNSAGAVVCVRLNPFSSRRLSRLLLPPSTRQNGQ